MKIACITVFLFATIALKAVPSPPQGLRIDYTRSGGTHQEHIHIYRLTQEPYFSGPPRHMLFPFDYGNHKVEVSLHKKDTITYSYHYNSLFREWQHIPYEANSPRTFPGSVKIPYPQQPVNICFYSRNHSQQWEKKQTFTIDPNHDMIRRTPPKDYTVEKIHDSGDYKEKMDLVILPDGYREDDMEQFHRDAVRFKDYLINCEPFKTHKDKINVWRVDVPSIDEGISKPHRGKWKHTAFSTHYNTFGFRRYITTNDHYSLREAAANTPYDLIFILVNETTYGGGGIFNFYSIASSGSRQAAYLMIHEFGHHMAFLADEYEGGTGYENYYPTNMEPLEPNITTLVAFDQKWKHRMAPTTPVPTPEKPKYKDQVGVFEGAGYETKGVFRPYMSCSMRSAQYDHFCPVCQQAIIRMIKYYANESLD